MNRNAASRTNWREARSATAAPKLSVLIVDDEPAIRAAVRRALQRDADVVLEASSGNAAIAIAESERPDLVILDLGLPDMDGLDVCRVIRTWSSLPIVVLSARTDEHEKVLILDAGADDYITKPFSTIELQARVRAHTRRAQMPPMPGAHAPVVIGDLIVDTARRSVTRNAQLIHLTPTEWALLRVLMSHAGSPITHQRLFTLVWGSSEGDAQSYLRVYIAHLRRKLETDSFQPRLILTEPGVGYRLVLAF